VKAFNTVSAIGYVLGRLFAWIFILLVICFKVLVISSFSMEWAAWVFGAVIIAIFYNLPLRILNQNKIMAGISISIYMGTIAILSLWAFNVMSQIGGGPLLIQGTIECGSSRVWIAVFFMIMEICAIMGLVNLMLSICKGSLGVQGIRC